MGKGGSVISSEPGGDESLNNGAVDELTLYRAERRVLDHQRKLHRWARPNRINGSAICST
jgi:hypothetical protein